MKNYLKAALLGALLVMTNLSHANPLLDKMHSQCSLEKLGIADRADLIQTGLYPAPTGISIYEGVPPKKVSAEEMADYKRGLVESEAALWRKVDCLLKQEQHEPDEVCENHNPVFIEVPNADGIETDILRNKDGVRSKVDDLVASQKAEELCTQGAVTLKAFNCPVSKKVAAIYPTVDSQLNNLALKDLITAREGRIFKSLKINKKCVPSGQVDQALKDYIRQQTQSFGKDAGMQANPDGTYDVNNTK